MMNPKAPIRALLKIQIHVLYLSSETNTFSFWSPLGPLFIFSFSSVCVWPAPNSSHGHAYSRVLQLFLFSADVFVFFFSYEVSDTIPNQHPGFFVQCIRTNIVRLYLLSYPIFSYWDVFLEREGEGFFPAPRRCCIEYSSFFSLSRFVGNRSSSSSSRKNRTFRGSSLVW